MYCKEFIDADEDDVVFDPKLLHPEVGSCDIFGLLTSENINDEQPTAFNDCTSVVVQVQRQLSAQNKDPEVLLDSPIPHRKHISKEGHQHASCETLKLKKRPLLSPNETHNLAEKRRRLNLKQKIKSLQELLPDCDKNDMASVLDEAIKHIRLLVNQAEWLKLHYMPMAPVYYPAIMLPSSQLQMLAPPLLPPRHLPPQLAGGSGVIGGASNQREDGSESNRSIISGWH